MAEGASPEENREKRTITEIRESEKAGEKMVYMWVPNDTSAKRAEMAGVDVAVVGDSLAVIEAADDAVKPQGAARMVQKRRQV